MLSWGISKKQRITNKTANMVWSRTMNARGKEDFQIDVQKMLEERNSQKNVGRKNKESNE